MPEGRSRTLLWILIGGGAFFLFVLAVFSLVYLTLHAGTSDAGLGGFGDRIGVVDLDGVILSPQPVVGQLKKFGDDSSIKAIILHVNSPGGGVAASEEIYREVKRIREEKKKRVVVSIETVGASGANGLDGDHNALLLLLADTLDLAVNLFRRGHAAAWRIDVQNNGLDGGIVAKLL